MAEAFDLPALPDSLPLKAFPAGEPWHRVHRAELHPVFFGPAPPSRPINRFDAPNGEYRVCYLGLSFSASFVETILRQPRLRTVPIGRLEVRSGSELTNTHPLKLVDLRTTGLAIIGTDNRISTMTVEEAGQWALKLWAHREEPDGILYRSRHDPGLFCAAVFDRPHCQFEVLHTTPLLDLHRLWRPILTAREKVLV